MATAEFSLNGRTYIIRNVNGKNYKEILHKDSLERVENEKDICRKFGIDVSTDANVMNTHKAIEILFKEIISK